MFLDVKEINLKKRNLNVSIIKDLEMHWAIFVLFLDFSIMIIVLSDEWQSNSTKLVN